MNFQTINRENIVKYYENKIDDIADETKREELFKNLQEIEDLMISLDGEIDKELEYQEAEIIDDYALADEFNYSCRLPM